MSYEVRINAAKFRRAVQGNAGRLVRGLGDAFHQIGVEMVSRGQSRIKGEFSKGSQGNRTHLQNRTGSLRRSGLRYFVAGDQGRRLQDLRMVLVITSPYGRIHEYGGTITPRSARALTIPLDANLDPSGNTRATAREWRATGETFVWKSPRSGRGFIARSVGGRLELLFVFAAQVRIPARWGLRDEWRGSVMRKVRGQEIGRALDRVLRSVS